MSTPQQIRLTALRDAVLDVRAAAIWLELATAQAEKAGADAGAIALALS